MTRKITRKEFLLSGAALLGAGLAVGCGGDETTATNNSQGGCSASTITSNHGHALSVPKADTVGGAEKTYSIKGSSGHDHSVVVTAAHFVSLAGGSSVTIESTSGAGHTHTVTITCV